MKNLILIIILVFIGIQGHAQRGYAAVYGNDGVLGKTIITLDEAKGIKGLSCFYLSPRGTIVSVEVYSFELLVISGSDTTAFENNNGHLTNQMLAKLNVLKAPGKLIFEGIIARYDDSGETQSMTYIPIEVK